MSGMAESKPLAGERGSGMLSSLYDDPPARPSDQSGLSNPTNPTQESQT